MTDLEKKMAGYIKENILPKLQEMQRDLFLDEHIRMEVNCESYRLCCNAYFNIKENSEGGARFLCTKEFSFVTFLSDEEEMRKGYEKTLRGMRHFVKNWQERLG